MSIKFDYYYGAEAEQFTFLRIPRVLLTEQHFKSLSMEAKVLYGLMLDRMGLSVKNQWLDKQNRVYIYFTLEDVQECLQCGHNKGVKLLAELDIGSGIGLIERVKQGQGRPTKIYVKNFNLPPSMDSSKVIRKGNPDFPKPEVQTSHNRKSRLPQNGSTDFPKKDTNYTNINQTYTNDTEAQSIYPGREAAEQTQQAQQAQQALQAPQSKQNHKNEAKTAIDMIDRYRELIQENLDYEYIIQDFPKERIDEIVEIMTEAVTTTKDFLYVGQERLPSAVVKSVLLKLNMEHIRYVIGSMEDNPTEIRNIRAYLLTCLYKAYSSMDNYYTAKVNHDFYGGGLSRPKEE